MNCVYCGEDVRPEEMIDSQATELNNLHLECSFRAVCGSVAHLQRRCSCYSPGSQENDPPGMTKREAARAALTLYRKLTELGVVALAIHRTGTDC